MTTTHGKQIQQTSEATEAVGKLPDDFKRLIEKDHKPAQGVFQDPARFAHAQRVATMLCASNLAPAHFQGQANLGSAVIAVDMAFRLNMNPLMVMQQLYVVHGKPGWSAQFVIAVINASGEFSPIRFRFSGSGDTQQCIAYAKDLKSGEVLDSTPVSIALAKKEGWFQKNGSKWQSMAEQMLAYRAASFWGRIYAPEMFMGLPTVEEIQDMDLPMPEVVQQAPKTKPNLGARPKKEDKPATAPEPAPEPPQVEPDPASLGSGTQVPETTEYANNDGDLGPQKPAIEKVEQFKISTDLEKKLAGFEVEEWKFKKWAKESGWDKKFIADHEAASKELISATRSFNHMLGKVDTYDNE